MDKIVRPVLLAKDAVISWKWIVISLPAILIFFYIMLVFPNGIFLKDDMFILGFAALLTMYIGDVVAMVSAQKQTLREMKIRSFVWFTVFVSILAGMVWFSHTFASIAGHWGGLLLVSLVVYNLIDSVKVWEKRRFIDPATGR